jgi:hypothetical protein
MPRYRFPIRNPDGKLVDDVDGVNFADDRTAKTYGMRVIEELKRDEPEGYLGWTMEIKEGERLVATLPFSTAH